MSLLAAGDQNRGLEGLQKTVELDPHEHGLEFGLSVSLRAPGASNEPSPSRTACSRTCRTRPSRWCSKGIAQAARQQDAEARAAFRRGAGTGARTSGVAGALAALDPRQRRHRFARGWYR